ncbi:MAG: hypothetical protein ACYTFQ_01260, partial [Planctomycetota bacterium]
MRIRRILKVFFVFVATVNLAHSASVGQKGDSEQEDYFAVFVESKKVGYAIEKRVVSSGKVTSSRHINVALRRIGT